MNNEEKDKYTVEFNGEDVKVAPDDQPAEPPTDTGSEEATVAEKPEKPAPDAKAKDATEKGKGKQEKATKHPASGSGVLGNKTLEDVIAREAKEEQDTSSPFSLSRTLGGVIIARAVQKQIWLVLLIGVFFIAYISMRYICQQKIVEISKIEKKMVDAHYKATVCTSELTKNSRESNVMKLLGMYGDSTLTIPKDPPFYIKEQE